MTITFRFSHICGQQINPDLYADVLAARQSGIVVGSILGVLCLVTIFWCIAFSICLQVSTCPLHIIYYKRTIQNLAEAPPSQSDSYPQTAL